MPLSMIFPLDPSSENNAGFDGFTDTDATGAIKQNMKMSLLTNKGEYVWDPNFGVGLSGYLFENESVLNTGILEGEIRNQSRQYMPYVIIDGINIEIDGQSQALKVQIRFRFNGIAIPELFEVEVSE